MPAAIDHRGNGDWGHASTVVVADPDPESRERLVRLLSLTGFHVYAVATGPDAIEATRGLAPAAVLLDVVLPEISGYQVCHLLRNEHGDGLSILLLSDTRTEPFDRAAGLLLGANDYIVKPFAPDELVARVVAHTRRTVTRVSGEELLANLTPSEQRVLRLLAEGMTTKSIALELSISVKTVGMHIHNAMKKLDVHSRSQAVALAHRFGLVDPQRPVPHPDVRVHGTSAAGEDAEAPVGGLGAPAT